ncbi:MAG: hypothetical protein AB6733_09095 [Clostridiaceae bacterium]
MLKKYSALLIYLIAVVILITACSKQEQKTDDKNFISILSEQPTNNIAYCYVVNDDRYILKDDVQELIEILQLEDWENEEKTLEEYTSKDIVINFNEFPKGKNEKNFDYNTGTYVTNQLIVQTEKCFAFKRSSGETKSERYLLNSDIINTLQTFISKKAISHEELIRRLN